MTLTNLKKRAPSASRPVMSVDEFIEEADYYAHGLSKVVTLSSRVGQFGRSDKALKRATFTLGEPALSQLATFSEQTGIAKSRLIRIWLDKQSEHNNTFDYVNSQVK